MVAQANCPYLSLVNSHYALVLPLWLHALPCDQLLLLEHDTFFAPAPNAPPTAASAASPTTELQPLIAMLRFAGFSTENATRLAQTPAQS